MVQERELNLDLVDDGCLELIPERDVRGAKGINRRAREGCSLRRHEFEAGLCAGSALFEHRVDRGDELHGCVYRDGLDPASGAELVVLVRASTKLDQTERVDKHHLPLTGDLSPAAQQQLAEKRDGGCDHSGRHDVGTRLSGVEQSRLVVQVQRSKVVEQHIWMAIGGGWAGLNRCWAVECWLKKSTVTRTRSWSLLNLCIAYQYWSHSRLSVSNQGICMQFDSRCNNHSMEHPTIQQRSGVHGNSGRRSG